MATSPTARVGVNVRAEMARRGVSQTELAKQLGISQAAVSARLRGHTPFDVNELARIAVVLSVPAAELLDETKASA